MTHNKHTRMLTIVVAVLCVAGMGVLISPVSASVSASSSSGITLHILGAPVTSLDTLIKFDPQFTKLTGIKVDVTEIPYENLEAKMILSLSSHSGQYDIVEPFTEMVPVLEASKWIVPLETVEKNNPSVPKIDFADFLPNYEKYYSGSTGGPQFVSYDPDTRVLYYNSALLKSKGIMSPPQTWAQLEHDAALFGGTPGSATAPASGTSETSVPYGYMESTATDPWIILTWIPVLYSSGQGVLNSSGCPELTTPRAVAATTMYMKMSNYGPKAAKNYTLFDIEPWMYKNDVAFADVDTAATPKDMQIEAYPLMTANTTRYGSGETGGWGFGIVATSKQQAAALKWIEWASSASVMLKVQTTYTSEGTARATPGRISLWSSPALQKDNPRWKGELPTIKTSEPFDPYPNEPQVESAIATQLSAILAGEESVSAGLSIAQAKVTPLMKEIGECK